MHENPSWTVVTQKAAADISYQALIPAVVLTALALVTVVLRWYSRVRLSGTYGAEDVLVTLALVFSMVFTGLVGGEFAIDIQQATPESRASLFREMMKLMFSGSIAYHSGVNLVRFSLLFQYRRVFESIRLFQPLLYVVGTATLGALAWGVFGIIFLCNPVRKYWEAAMPGHCMDAEDHFWSSAVIGIVLDFVIWTMPMPVVGRLRLEARQKVGLLVPFGLGLFVCIVSVLRVVHVHGAAEHGEVSKSGSYAAIWSTAEVNVAIICSSLIVMKPLLSRLIPSLSTDNGPSAYEEDRSIRRVMSISTMQESLAAVEVGSIEPRCETYVWTDSSDSSNTGESSKGRSSVGRECV